MAVWQFKLEVIPAAVVGARDVIPQKEWEDCTWWLSHDIWGEAYPGDGQKGFGVLMMLAVYGMGIASAYVVLGSIGQFFLRRKAFRISLLFDVSLFALITLILVIAGVQAKYGEVEAAQSSSASHSQVARVHV